MANQSGVPASREPSALDGANAKCLHLWLVDDDPDFCEFFKTILTRYPDLNCAQQFQSAAEALVALAQLPPPQVILLDYQMPGLNGLEALPHFRRLAPLSPVVILSSFYDPACRQAALDAGAVAYLGKTERCEKIIATIRSAPAVPLSVIAARTTVLTPGARLRRFLFGSRPKE